ncbi:phosphoglycerate kinase [Candidatus Dependentiae bacterium]|nr:phosphoglycerate kinase [Candidatus Dependentiae bacterium]
MDRSPVVSSLTTMNLRHRRVFVRADLNVPLHGNNLLDDYRLQKILPTINAIQKQRGYIILATHLGRPRPGDTEPSTKHLIPWFEHQGYHVIFETDLSRAAERSHDITTSSTILLLENMRLFAGEQSGDTTFAQQLRACADIYVNDAFGVLHRHDTSVTLLAQLFEPHKRTIGLLVEQELAALNRLLSNPPQPFMLILGGGKIADKIPLIEHMLKQINTLFLCPAPVFTFLKALGKPVGKSLVDEQQLEQCLTILRKAQDHNVTVIVPCDYLVAHRTYTGTLTYASAEHFPHEGIGISIGAQTLYHITPYIQHAGTIFYNGAMGMLERPDTLHGMKQVLELMTQTQALTVLGGGSSAAVAQRYGMVNGFDHVSTGGGAMLAYLSGSKLPGLEALGINK